MKRIAAIGFLFGFIFSMHGQEDAVLDSVVSNIAKQLLIFPQEKIYMQTDKPYYIIGEKIFFRVFLLDAFFNKQDTLSRYVYVELINPMDSIVERLKIRKDANNLFYGAIPLSEELPQGDYQIRAYTQYMRNQGESSFFSKQVQISDPQILSKQVQTDFQFADDGKVNTSLRFINTKTKEAIQPQSVTLRLNQDPSFTRKPDQDGWIRVKLNVPNEAITRVLYVELTDDKRIFRQYIHIPYPKDDFDVSFYPEGGHLIAGQSSEVAFKALDAGSSSLDIKGEVIDSKGNTITEFKTIHDGMGEFFIKPQPNEHYQAICHSENRTLHFDLPEVQKNALALKTISQNNKLLVTINKPDSVSCPELYLLIHSRGSVIYAKDWSLEKDFIAFDTSIFPSGISHILLLTKDLQIISERLVFLLNDDNGIAKFQTQKDAYQKREQVQAEIQLKDEAQQPLKGNFSIAVTSDKEVVTDSTLSILSDILLRSELRGNIENPEYYFQKGNKEAEVAADLLMKTNGWTRYAIPEVIKGKFTYPKIFFERSQEISGIIKSGLVPKPAKNFKVSLVSISYGFFDKTETDENGHFVFRNFEFPDSTKYIIQASDSKWKGNRMAELYLDEDTFPGINTNRIEPINQKEKSNPVLLDYVEKAVQYSYENGKRMVNLPEVEIKGINKKNNEYTSPYYSEPDYSFSENDIKRFSGMDIKNLLYRVPGVVVSAQSIRIKGAQQDPLIVIDGMPITLTTKPAIKDRNGKEIVPPQEQSAGDILDNININDIGQIDVLTSITNLSGFSSSQTSSSENGVIVIYTKRSELSTSLPSLNIKPIIPLGYQLPIEFYSPKYDMPEKIDDSKPDLRTTIYWKPNVFTDDAGNAKLDFYTSDDPSTYSVIIEGVSDDGKLIHYRGNASIVVK